MKKDKSDNIKVISPSVIRSELQLANSIRRIRKIQGLSQTALAEKAGVTQATISRIEKGSKDTSIGTLFLLFSAMNVDLQITAREKNSSSLEGLI
jgi:HTH-type transcriptional regulator/antitoxin HipB